MLKVKLLLSSIVNKIFFIFFIFLISCSSIDKNPTEYSKVGIKTSCKKQIGYGFWDYFFEQFPQIRKFIEGEDCFFPNGNLYNRNNETGGSLLLRPVGQKLFTQIYCAFRDKGQLDELTSKIPSLDFNLNGSYCKYVTWNNKMLPKSETLQRRVFFYALGLSSDSAIHNDLRSVYENYGANYNNIITII